MKLAKTRKTIIPFRDKIKWRLYRIHGGISFWDTLLVIERIQEFKQNSFMENYIENTKIHNNSMFFLKITVTKMNRFKCFFFTFHKMKNAIYRICSCFGIMSRKQSLCSNKWITLPVYLKSILFNLSIRNLHWVTWRIKPRKKQLSTRDDQRSSILTSEIEARDYRFPTS